MRKVTPIASTDIRLVCIADPQSLRFKAFKIAFEKFAADTNRKTQLELIPWRALIAADGNPNEIAEFDASSFATRPALVRIESPAKDFEVRRCLLAAGARETNKPEDEKWSQIEYEKGMLVEPGLAFCGFKRILTRFAGHAKAIDGFDLLANPHDIASMFDKNETSKRLSEAGIATPNIEEFLPWDSRLEENENFPDEAAIDFVDDLRQRGHKTTYVKLAFGSSSSGMVFINSQIPRSLFIATSTMAYIKGNFFNTRLLEDLDVEQLAIRLSYLHRQGLTIQKGINKSTVDGDNFDVRAIVINGRVEFTIFRASRNPITNLQLGGYRGDWLRCRKSIPNRAWLDAMDDCVRAAELYDSHIVGVDLAFDRNYLGHWIIELNPFGDFFPGWKNDEGKSVHEVELESLLG